MNPPRETESKPGSPTMLGFLTKKRRRKRKRGPKQRHILRCIAMKGPAHLCAPAAPRQRQARQSAQLRHPPHLEGATGTCSDDTVDPAQRPQTNGRDHEQVIAHVSSKGGGTVAPPIQRAGLYCCSGPQPPPPNPQAGGSYSRTVLPL